MRQKEIKEKYLMYAELLNKIRDEEKKDEDFMLKKGDSSGHIIISYDEIRDKSEEMFIMLSGFSKDDVRFFEDLYYSTLEENDVYTYFDTDKMREDKIDFEELKVDYLSYSTVKFSEDNGIELEGAESQEAYRYPKTEEEKEKYGKYVYTYNTLEEVLDLAISKGWLV